MLLLVFTVTFSCGLKNQYSISESPTKIEVDKRIYRWFKQTISYGNAFYQKVEKGDKCFLFSRNKQNEVICLIINNKMTILGEFIFKSGKGPNEFINNTAVFMYRDTVYVYDATLNRLSAYDDTMKFIDTMNINDMDTFFYFYEYKKKIHAFSIKNNIMSIALLDMDLYVPKIIKNWELDNKEFPRHVVCNDNKIIIFQIGNVVYYFDIQNQNIIKYISLSGNSYKNGKPDFENRIYISFISPQYDIYFYKGNPPCNYVYDNDKDKIVIIKSDDKIVREYFMSIFNANWRAVKENDKFYLIKLSAE